MFQILCPTSTWNSPALMPSTSNSYIFMCFRASCSTQRFHKSCDPELLAQQKHQILMFLRAHAQHNYQILMCLKTQAQHKYLIVYVLQGPRPRHKIIYIKHMQLAYTQYIKQIIILMCSGVLCQIYKIKHQSNIIRNGAYSRKC